MGAQDINTSKASRIAWTDRSSMTKDGCGERRATRSVYFKDPDGLVLEAYVGDDTLPDSPLSIVATSLQIDFDTGTVSHR